jgi:hypothetical protein
LGVKSDSSTALSQTRATAADGGFEGFVEAHVVGVGRGETLARCLHAVTPPLEIGR